MTIQTVITGYIGLATALSAALVPTEQTGTGYARLQVPVQYDPATGKVEFPKAMSWLAGGSWSASTHMVLYDAASNGNALLAWQIPSFTLSNGGVQSYAPNTFDFRLTTQFKAGVWVLAGTTLGTVANRSGAVLASSLLNPVTIIYSGTTLAAATPTALAVINYGTVITPDILNGINQRVTLTGNTTIAVPTNGLPGSRLRLQIVQDATGTRTVTLGSGIKIAGGAPTATAAAGSIDILDIINDGSLWTGRYDKAFA
jgi:hypothetical protein